MTAESEQNPEGTVTGDTSAGESSQNNPVLSRLRVSLAQLGPGERRVIQAILDNPAGIADMSTSDLAAVANCSSATVIRACQNVGFRGYQHLRLELAKGPLTLDSHEGSILDIVFKEAAESVAVGRGLIPPELFEETVDALLSAHRIMVLAAGFSMPPAQDAALRMTTLGATVMIPSDIFAQQFVAHQLTEDDVCLVVSYSGANKYILQTVNAAREIGRAKIISISSFTQSPLVKLSDIALVTGPVSQSNDIDPQFSRISHSLVLYALYRGMLHKKTQNEQLLGMQDVVFDALSEDINFQ